MCAILDNDVVHQVFISGNHLNSQSDTRPEAGKAFFKWIDSGKGSLVVGGKLLRELAATHSFSVWMKEHLRSGSRRVRRVKDQAIHGRTQTLETAGSCQSNDEHVIALAQISGARLLYSNDKKLHQDFKNKTLINPPGKIYSTLQSKNFTDKHKGLLNRQDLCKT